MPSHPRRLFLAASVAFSSTIAVLAAAAATYKFDLPASDAGAALKLFSDQSGQQVIYPSDLVKDVQTHSVRGDLTAEDALNQMLAGTSLEVVRDDGTGAFALRRRAAGPKDLGAGVQMTNSRPASGQKTDNGIVALSPFEVQTNKDTSYGALNSNSITRFNTELEKTPVVADIFTQQFINDTGVESLQDLFGTYGVGAGMTMATPSSDSQKNQPGDRYTTSEYGVRGVSAGTPRLDGFDFSPTNTNATTLFDIERVDVLHGSQGLLYGSTGPGGLINLVSKQAHFDTNNGSVQERIDQYGSKRSMIDDNIGPDGSPVAVRFVAIDQDTNFRRLFQGDDLEGYYGAMAVRLPHNTTLQLNAGETHDTRVLPNNVSANFGNVATDPRSGTDLGALIATNQLGATNPATGQPYGGGAIDNGNVNWENYLSYMGWRTEEDISNDKYEAQLNTVWTKWLSTDFAALYDWNTNLQQTSSKSLTSPPVNGVVEGGNPFDAWAMSSSLGDTENVSRKKSYRGDVLITNDFFGGVIHSQTSLGFNREYSDSSSVKYAYYLAASDGNIALNTAASNLGRTSLPTLWWNVNNGPVEYPFPKVGAQSLYYNGSQGGTAGTYLRQAVDPRNSAWITPTNPLGLASLYEASISSTGLNLNGVSSGSNGGEYSSQSRDQGYYLANYASWWDDMFETLTGFRLSDEFTRNPNTTAGMPYGWAETRTNALPSYNFGVDFRIPHVSWLRGYVEYSRTFDLLGAGNADVFGNNPPYPNGYTYEGGLKFTITHNDSNISGYVSAFRAYTNNRNYSESSQFEDTVNDPGLNGQYVAPGGSSPGTFAVFNQNSRGVELAVTGQKGSNFRWRLGASLQDGTVTTTSEYPMVYNDQFYTNASGEVTYSNGQPFMVPTDQSTLAKVFKLNTPTDPSSYNVALTPLTLAMINNPTSPYYAFATGALPVNPAILPQNEPVNGAIGSAVTGGTANALYNALKYFNINGLSALTGVNGLPISAIQYNWANPAGYKGVVVAQEAGDATVGYPVIAANFTGEYSFSQGWLRGFGIGGTISGSWYNRAYWYTNPDQSRGLFENPIPSINVDSRFSYTRKLGRLTFRTQITINNMFNRYNVAVYPNNGTGYSNPTNLNATFYGVPRQYLWTSEVDF